GAGDAIRFDALARLRRNASDAGTGPQFDLLSAQALLRVGDRTEAARIATQIGRELPDSPEALTWQARMLHHLGRLDDAETALRAMAERRPGGLEPWLQLLRFQAGRKRFQAVAETIRRVRTSVKTDHPELIEAQCLAAAGDASAPKAFAAALAKTPGEVAVL